MTSLQYELSGHIAFPGHADDLARFLRSAFEPATVDLNERGRALLLIDRGVVVFTASEPAVYEAAGLLRTIASFERFISALRVCNIEHQIELYGSTTGELIEMRTWRADPTTL